jgi:hypothetical protein
MLKNVSGYMLVRIFNVMCSYGGPVWVIPLPVGCCSDLEDRYYLNIHGKSQFVLPDKNPEDHSRV